ncbi:CAP domain-containing protein [Mycolicibacterium elephantis]|uniref:CAP domain-containing protein n=1 Tax=Mycolicibacterium elephantis TaxID=81858 RepID=UPI000B236B1D|nr:CAP domain-containing protein [Mycolicibacterium elephantis]
MINRRVLPAATAVAVVAVTLTATPAAQADNKRLNNGVFANIYTAQKQNGCPMDPLLNDRLTEAARLHTLDVLANRNIDGDIGTDGSTPQQRAEAAGFTGLVAQTVAINHSLAINNRDVLMQWWHDPAARATMEDCRYTQIGVWSENSLDRSVVVAVYGQPQ